MKYILSVLLVVSVLVFLAFKTNVIIPLSARSLFDLPLSRLTHVRVQFTGVAPFPVLEANNMQNCLYVDLPVSSYALAITEISLSNNGSIIPISISINGHIAQRIYNNSVPTNGGNNSYDCSNYHMTGPVLILPGQTAQIIYNYATGPSVVYISGYALLPGEF